MGWGGKNEMLLDVGGWGLVSVLDVQSLFFYIKENSIWAMTRDHANHILLTRYLPLTLTSDSVVIL